MIDMAIEPTSHLILTWTSDSRSTQKLGVERLPLLFTIVKHNNNNKRNDKVRLVELDVSGECDDAYR